MKATRTLANRACLFGIGALMLPNAAQAACFLAIGEADGRIQGAYQLGAGGNDISLRFAVETGRSYTVDVIKTGGFPATLTMNINNGFCPPSDISSGVTIRDTSLVTPSVFGGNNGQRRSIVVTGAVPGNFLDLRVGNSEPNTSFVTFRVSETTLYSPGWSTFGGSQTFWSFSNTTNATINGTLTILNTSGTQIATASQAIPSGTAFFPSTITMAIAAGQAGTARFTHDGPRTAFIAEGAITNFITFFQRVNFVAPRQ